MIDFLKACESARNVLIKREYKDGFSEICDLGDRWLFLGKMFEEGIVEYGNCPITVCKSSGQCEDYPLSDIKNYDTYYKSESVIIPTEYVIKD